MKLVFIRHADPDYPNNTLTEKGFLEAEALAKCYSSDDFDYIYTSPLPRARITCDTVIKGKKEVHEVKWLEEFGHPLKYKGKTIPNWDLLPTLIEENKDDLISNNYLESELMKSGDISKHINEVISNFDKVLKEHGYQREGLNYKVINPNKDTIVFFGHLGIISVLISHLIHIPYWQVAQYFCLLTSSVTTFISEERHDDIAQFRCYSLSDISHLKKAGLKPSFAARFRETRLDDDRID